MTISFYKNKNKDIVKTSSSGGVFSSLANYVIENKGVVFGAVFDKSFNVVIDYTEDNFQPMIGSKYVQSSTGDSFRKCKEFLDKGRLVLYSGTPCQIIGLKSFLHKEYENLITVDVICHGTARKEIWQHYIKSFGKDIESVNFRDKGNDSWSQFRISIKFKDGSMFTENHNDNAYFKLFVENKILKESCYTCSCCKNSKADITLGDAWGCNAKNSYLKNDEGTSCVITHTDKGKNILTSLQSNFIIEDTDISYLEKNSVGYVHNYTIPSDRENIINGILRPRIAMITIPGHNNVGNTLQAFALQSKIKEILPEANVVLINDFDLTHNKLDFYKKHVSYINEGYIDGKYDMMIVGSDQIWGNTITPDWKIPLEDIYALRNVKKIFYAPSFGFAQSYIQSKPDLKTKISLWLKNEKYISSRESFGSVMFMKMFGVHCETVIDPTLLYPPDFYVKSIHGKLTDDTNGIFAYILDKSIQSTTFINECSEKMGEPLLQYDGSVENFIQNMNKCKYVITDSYHGTCFSLIFGKSFITYKNRTRGNMRFDDLEYKFDLADRFISEYDIHHIDILKTTLDVNTLIHDYKIDAEQFLMKGLHQL